MRRALISSSLVLALAACEGPRASIDIEDARVSRDEGGKIVAEVDLLAHDQLGGSVGNYCTQVVFATEAPVERCDADLEDGDRRTMRWVSLGEHPPGTFVNVRVRLGAVDTQRLLVAP